MSIDFNILVRLQQNDPTLIEVDLTGQSLTKEDLRLLVKALINNTHLTSLNVSNNQIDDEGAIILSCITMLTSLDISKNRLGVKGIKALNTNTNLASLNISCNQLGDEGAEALSPNTSLISLDASENQLGDKGAEAISRISSLISLSLRCNQIKMAGAYALSAHKALNFLDISENQLGNEGAVAFRDNTTLLSLNISCNQIGNLGAYALSKNTTLRSLYISGMNLNDEIAEALRVNIPFTTLNLNQIDNEETADFRDNTSLDIGSNKIGPAGAYALSCNTTLRLLDLSSNKIGDQGVAAFRDNTTLISLNVRNNGISNKGVLILSRNNTLLTLNLMQNQITEKVADALSANTSLTCLDISTSSIGIKGLQKLITNTYLTALSPFNIYKNEVIEQLINQMLVSNQQHQQIRRNRFIFTMGKVLSWLAADTDVEKSDKVLLNKQNHENSLQAMDFIEKNDAVVMTASLPEELVNFVNAIKAVPPELRIHIGSFLNASVYLQLAGIKHPEHLGKTEQQVYQCALFLLQQLASHDMAEGLIIEQKPKAYQALDYRQHFMFKPPSRVKELQQDLLQESPAKMRKLA